MLGTFHHYYACCLNNMAQIYSELGHLSEAEPLFEEARQIVQYGSGEKSAEYAVALNNMAGLYARLDNHHLARRLLEQTLEIQKVALSELDPQYIGTLSNLGDTYRQLGEYSLAFPLLIQARSLAAKSFGVHDAHYGDILNNLAILYADNGRFSEVQTLLEQAVDIQQRLGHEAHPKLAVSLQNLAIFLSTCMHDYLQSEQLLNRAGEILRATFGDQHPEYATNLVYLGNLYGQLKQPRALLVHQQAAEIRKRALGDQHPEYLISIVNLMGLYSEFGQYNEAKSLYELAIALVKVTDASELPIIGNLLHNLALMDLKTAQWGRAQVLFEQLLQIRETAVESRGYDYSKTLRDAAVTYAANNRCELALHLMLRALTIEDRHIISLAACVTERESLQLLDSLRSTNGEFLSLLIKHFCLSTPAVQAGFELVLRRKALGAEIQARRQLLIRSTRHPGLQQQLEELNALRRQIARRSLKGSPSETPAKHLAAIQACTRSREALERQLCSQIPELELDQKLRNITITAVDACLPSGSALVEIFSTDIYDFHANQALGQKIWKPARYLAFLLLAGQPDAVAVYDLGDTDAIDNLIEQFLGAIAEDPIGNSYIACGRALRQAIFDPLTKDLQGHEHLFLSPDGNLNLLSFDTLTLEDGSFLGERYEITYLTTGRDLLRYSWTPIVKLGPSVVAANPDFRLGGQTKSVQPNDSFGFGQGRRSRDLNHDQLRFDPLLGAHREGASVSVRIAAQQLWTGVDVLESKIKAIRSPQILHIATHGFFLPDQRHDLNQLSRLIVIGDVHPLQGPGMENPMLRSGLALAGAQTYLEGGSLPPEAEDGLLTAEDVSGMDLRGTELVVLSACNSGLGEARVGQGVFGLRRAFEIAGAHTMITSLWKADDAVTCELMTAFYDALKNGRTKMRALRSAQQKVRRKYSHPYYWGAFILVGHDGELHLQ
jgi:CHAT domain-containing protein